ncbi:MAG: amidohydrolase [Polaromonas sp.]|uniref:amidohydrolase family protein n=1 Tax=Polaromonas sp. TaxID=1869339 RepID=UPI00403742FC|nr:amidohydrolase [Polaromonas sp.]
MDRRRFLQHAAAPVTALATMSIPAFAQSAPASTGDLAVRAASIEAWRQRLQGMLDKGRLPMIDIQATYVPGVTNIGQLMAWMDEVDIAQIAFATASSPDSGPSLELHRQYPGYFIPTTSSGEFPRWWNNPAAFVSRVAADLKTGNYYTMGEHEFRHYPSPEQVEARNNGRDITVPLDGPAGHALFQLSEDTGTAFQIHYEIEDPLLPVLESMLARYPKARVIWCHLGMIRYPDRAKAYNPAYVKSLITRFPHLHFDLAVPRAENIYRPSGARDSTIFQNGRLGEEWQALMEGFPDRFLVASDYRPPVESLYRTTMGRHRNQILGPLSEAVRHKLAYGNAWRLVTGNSWGA